MGFSLFFLIFFYHSVITQMQAVVTVYYHCIVFLLPFNGDSMFQNACMVYKHAVVAAFRIYAQRGEVAAKRGGWSLH